MGNIRSGAFKKRTFNGVMAVVTAVFLAACASTSDSDSAPPPPSSGQSQSGAANAGGACDMSLVQYAIGAPFNEANVAQLQSESGATQARVLRPGSAATMDYREDRLNIHLDSDDKVEALRCG